MMKMRMPGLGSPMKPKKVSLYQSVLKSMRAPGKIQVRHDSSRKLTQIREPGRKR